MNYILFDGTARDALLPFTFTRPVADIRVGILTIREKWEKYLGNTTTTITEDYLSEDIDEQPNHSSHSHSYSTGHQQTQSTINKRLFRDTDSGMVGGVCSGISHYFGMDPIWFRLAIVLSVLFLGTGVFLYIILWIIMPEARTSAEKLSMKGEPVTFDNIGKTVEEEINNVKKS